MEVSFEPSTPDDLERLTALKLQVMNPQLDRIGRLDSARSAARFAREFRPGATRRVLIDGRFAGCVTVYPEADAWVIEHFYLRPEQQGRGVGSEILRRLLAEADAAGAAVRLSVLTESAANRFYPRFGFVETNREDFDIYYRRAPAEGSVCRAPTGTVGGEAQVQGSASYCIAPATLPSVSRK